MRKLLGEQMRAVLVATIRTGSTLSCNLLDAANLLFVDGDWRVSDRHSRNIRDLEVLRSIWCLVEDLSAMVGSEWPAVEREVKLKYFNSMVTTSSKAAAMQEKLPFPPTSGEGAHRQLVYYPMMY